MMQYGDGTGALIPAAAKEQADVLLPLNDEPLCDQIGSQTDSLCGKYRPGKFRHHLRKELPQAIFLGTDVIENCFPLSEMELRIQNLYWNFADEIRLMVFRMEFTTLKTF